MSVNKKTKSKKLSVDKIDVSTKSTNEIKPKVLDLGTKIVEEKKPEVIKEIITEAKEIEQEKVVEIQDPFLEDIKAAFNTAKPNSVLRIGAAINVLEHKYPAGTYDKEYALSVIRSLIIK